MKDPLSVGDGARASLIERLREKVIMGGGYADIAGDDLESLIQQLERTQALYDELMAGYDRLRADTDAAIRLRLPAVLIEGWQQIQTAPVKPWTPELESYYRFNCLLQNERGHVGEGWAYYGRKRAKGGGFEYELKWANRTGQCFPVLWMPLPVASSKHAPSSAPPDAGSRG